MAEAQPQQVNRPNPLGPFHPTRKFSEPERWICIYPAYLNSNKTRQEGRLLPKEKVSWVMEFPTWGKKIKPERVCSTKSFLKELIVKY